MSEISAPASNLAPRQLREMRALVESKDWSTTALGSRDDWSASLNMAVGIVLASGFPMALRWGPEFALIYNDAYRPILGDKHPWALGMRASVAWSEVWPQIEPLHLAIMSGASEAVFTDDTVLRIQRFKDRWEDAHFTLGYSPVPDPAVAGGVGGIFVTALEITERIETEREVQEAQAALRKANQALEAEQAFLRDLFQHAPSFMAVLRGPDHRFELANDAYTQLIGHRDVVGKTVREALPEVQGQGFFELLDSVFATGEPYIGRRMPASLQRGPNASTEQRYLDLLYQPIRNSSSEMIGIFVDGFDITERVAAEDALRELNETLELQVHDRTRERDRLWRNTQDLIAVVDAQGLFTAANPAWTKLLGWNEAEIVGRHHLDLNHPDDGPRSADALRRAMSEGLPSYESRIRHKNGEYRWISWVASAEGELVYASGRHITAEKKAAEELGLAQEALRQSQKMEAIGQLTGGIAHDFNNLLAGIAGSLELIQKRINDGGLAGFDRHLGIAQGSTQRAASLTQRLLAFSRRQTLDPKALDVNRLISGMEDLIRRTVGPSIEVAVVGAIGLWATKVDPSQLENAVLNLAINARDAMPDGGRITIETANKSLDGRAGKERDLPPGQYISLCVTDTGTGMTPEVIERAFDPFYTTKPLGQGTGLGLSMIHGFVRQSGGQVRIYSELGHGTTMCVYFPRFIGEAEADEPEEGGNNLEPGHGGTVLVIDDEEAIRMLIRDVLEEAGYRVLEAQDGPSGLKVLQSEARVDLLITDVGLPGGFNGRQVADAARQTRPELKVLFVTGYAENAVVGNGHLDPGMRVITKPFSITSLAVRVRQIIEGCYQRALVDPDRDAEA